MVIPCGSGYMADIGSIQKVGVSCKEGRSGSPLLDIYQAHGTSFLDDRDWITDAWDQD